MEKKSSNFKSLTKIFIFIHFAKYFTKLAMFKHLRIGVRLGIGFGLLVALLVVLAGVALANMQAMKRATDEATKIAWPEAHKVSEVKTDITQMAVDCRDLLLSKDPAEEQRIATQLRDSEQASHAVLRKLAA